MISYNNQNLKNLFQFKKADTFRRLIPYIMVVAAYSVVVCYVEQEILKLPDNSPLKQLTIFHTLLGFVISMLLVFRTNTAYDRWWEGRRQWGALTNNSRNLAIKLETILPTEDALNRTYFRKIIPLFAKALRRHLHAETTRLELDTEPHPEIPAFDQNKHLPVQVAGAMMGKVQQLQRAGVLSAQQLLFLNVELQSFMEVCGACERIKNTPIPYSYNSFIKKFIFVYTVTLPIGLSFTLHYFVVPLVALVFYVLGSLEMIAEEIEDPFGKDENDLPLERISENIKKNVEDIISC